MGSFDLFLLSFNFLRFQWTYYFIFWGFLGSFTFFGATYYFVDMWTIILAILVQWSLLYCFLSLPSSYCWASSPVGPFLSKNGHQQWDELVQTIGLIIHKALQVTSLVHNSLFFNQHQVQIFKLVLMIGSIRELMLNLIGNTSNLAWTLLTFLGFVYKISGKWHL